MSEFSKRKKFLSLKVRILPHYRYLQKSISNDSGIRRQDATSAFASVYDGNPEGVDIAFEFLRNHYEQIAN